MGWDRNTWRKNVSEMLFEMASVRFQQAIWQAEIPGLMHSFSELICNIDDYAIPDGLSIFVAQGIAEESEAKELAKISDDINLLMKKYPNIVDWPASQIIANEDWLKIVSRARSLFNEWFHEDFVRYPEHKKLYLEWW